MKNPKTKKIGFITITEMGFGSAVNIVRENKKGTRSSIQYIFARNMPHDIKRFDAIVDYLYQNNYQIAAHFKDCQIQMIEYFPPIISDSSIYLSEEFSGIAGSIDIQVDEEEKDHNKEFISDILRVYKKHNMALSHEDSQGGFTIEPLNEYVIERLINAYVDDRFEQKELSPEEVQSTFEALAKARPEYDSVLQSSVLQLISENPTPKKPRNIAEWINEILEEEEVDHD